MSWDEVRAWTIAAERQLRLRFVRRYRRRRQNTTLWLNPAGIYGPRSSIYDNGHAYVEFGHLPHTHTPRLYLGVRRPLMLPEIPWREVGRDA